MKKKRESQKTVDQEINSIDASGQALGRLASRIALILQGKNKPDYLPYKDSNIEVVIKNIAKMKITGRKLGNKKYFHYSGYPGGLKTTKLEELFKKDPAKVLWKAVYNMLPKNKLRNKRMRRLKTI